MLENEFEEKNYPKFISLMLNNVVIIIAFTDHYILN